MLAAPVSRYRCRVYDTVTFFQVLHGFTGNVKERNDIGLKGFPYLCARYVLKFCLRELDSGIVNQNIQPAQCLNCFGNCLLAKIFIFKVPAYQAALPAFFLYKPFSLFSILVLIIIYYGNIGTFARKVECSAAAYTAVTTCNECLFALKLVAALVIFTYYLGFRVHFIFIARLAL